MVTSSESQDKNKNCNVITTVLFLLDQLLAGLVVGPLCAFYWWGAYLVINANLCPDDPGLRGGICMAVGNVGLLILLYTQDLWAKYIHKEVWWQWLFGYHIYNLLLSASNVCHWLGIWTLLDTYTGFGVVSVWTCYAIGQGMMIFLRCTNCLLAPPNLILLNNDDNFFEYSTRFKTKRSLSLNYIYDSLFTVVVIHQLVVLYWRGVWGILDNYLYPDNKLSSMFASLVISYTIMVSMCLVQPLLNLLYRWLLRYQLIARHAELLRWVIEVFHLIFNNFTNVNMWRWIWLFSSLFVYPSDTNAGFGIGIAVGLGVLIFMCSGASVTIKGVILDGDKEDHLVGYLPNFYLRTFYQKFSERRRVKEEKGDAEAVVSGEGGFNGEGNLGENNIAFVSETDLASVDSPMDKYVISDS